MRPQARIPLGDLVLYLRLKVQNVPFCQISSLIRLTSKVIKNLTLEIGEISEGDI
jgi:hypothetical protein